MSQNRVLEDMQLEWYLLRNGFYVDKLSPRFYGEETCVSEIQNLHAPCLRLDTDDPRNGDHTLRIFVTDSEIYAEVQNDYRSFERSYYIPAPHGVNVVNIYEYINIIIRE
ncbi:hypothetical protein BC01_141 [Bacillus phage BC01]|nr:hypothetical protein BC01_141 [Bacillus phage BC01]